MKLEYFKGNNFGDALNPLIFKHYLPGLFDDESDGIAFLGIGSILGFDLAKDASKKMIFSSGFAYGEKPEIDSTYDFICVRGPLTAKALNLDPSLAVADGAILLQFMDIPKPQTKKYKFSFIPHWGSEQKYTKWGKLCESADVHFISPMSPIDQVLQEIQESEVVIAEAMHGAIVADTLGVPWIPVKAYPTINEFKWNDWASSLDVKFEFHSLPSMYENNEFMLNKLGELSKGMAPKFVLKGLLSILEKTYYGSRKSSVIQALEEVKKQKTHLSDRTILHAKGNVLLEKLESIKTQYQNKVI